MFSAAPAPLPLPVPLRCPPLLLHHSLQPMHNTSCYGHDFLQIDWPWHDPLSWEGRGQDDWSSFKTGHSKWTADEMHCVFKDISPLPCCAHQLWPTEIAKVEHDRQLQSKVTVHSKDKHKRAIDHRHDMHAAPLITTDKMKVQAVQHVTNAEAAEAPAQSQNPLPLGPCCC